MSARIKLRVVQEKCQGHARCHALAPELFWLDEFGNAQEVSRATIPSELEDNAFMSRANCPEGAILIEDSEQGSAVLADAGGSNSAAPTVQSGGKPMEVRPDCQLDSKPK
jgi:ferredoxin